MYPSRVPYGSTVPYVRKHVWGCHQHVIRAGNRLLHASSHLLPLIVPQIMDPAALLNCVQRLTALQEAVVPPGQAPRNNSVKLQPFSSADPVEWRQWRTTFTNVATNNRWDAATARTHADAMITGVAKSIIENIPLNNMAVGGVAVAPVEQLLLLYDAKFVTPAAAANSRQMLFSAHQLDEETILLWHSRL